MRAVAVFPYSREVKLIDVEEPQIARATEVKLRMLDVGICGADKAIRSFQYGTPPDGSDYLILGHESLGEVVEVGPGDMTRCDQATHRLRLSRWPIEFGRRNPAALKTVGAADHVPLPSD